MSVSLLSIFLALKSKAGILIVHKFAEHIDALTCGSAGVKQSMNTKKVLTTIIVIVVAAGGWWLLTRDTTPPLQDTTPPLQELPSAKTFDLNVKERTLTPNIVTVTQGDEVVLLVSADEAGEFHISGYEIEKEIKVGGTIEVRFTANLAGRYNFELHPESSKTDEDLEIGAFVVNPQ